MLDDALRGKSRLNMRALKFVFTFSSFTEAEYLLYHSNDSAVCSRSCNSYETFDLLSISRCLLYQWHFETHTQYINLIIHRLCRELHTLTHPKSRHSCNVSQTSFADIQAS